MRKRIALLIGLAALVIIGAGIYVTMPSIFGSVVVPLPEEYKAMLVENAKKYNVDSCFGAATIQVESRWNPKATSSAPAKGLAQIIDGTFYSIAKKYDIDASKGPYDPATNIAVMMALHRYNIDSYGANLRNLGVAYNAGGGRVKLKDSELPRETKGYLPKLSRAYNLYSSVYPDFCTGPSIAGGPAIVGTGSDDGLADFTAPTTAKPAYVDLNNFWKSFLNK